MKSKISIQTIQEQFGLQYPELRQISDEPETGFIRLVGYLTDYPLWKEKKWYLFAETIYINPANNKIHRTEPTTSKNNEWIITNDYKVILSSGGVPVANPDFKTEEAIEVIISYNEETGEPIYETQTLPKEISIENSPFILVNAFDFYYGVRHNRELNLSMPELWEQSIIADDMWGYFDKKDNHFSVIDVVKIIYNQMSGNRK